MFQYAIFSGTPYQKLHRKLTIFCTCITDLILLSLSILCVFVAEKNIAQSNEASFLTTVNSVLTHLQEQNTISHSWLNQLQEDRSTHIYLYDNVSPLFYEQYHSDDNARKLSQTALAAAKTQMNSDPFATRNKKLSTHTEFQFESEDGMLYHASVGCIPKTNGYLNFLILRSLSGQNIQFLRLRLVVVSANISAFLLLFFFFRFFIWKMLQPAVTAQKKQTQFIASASHELRTPLSVIRSGLESIGKCKSDADRAHFLHLMSDETLRMKKLIDDMLLLANSDSDTLSVKPESCQPDVLLLDTFEKFETMARKKNIRLSISLPEDEFPDCLCDLHRTEQIFSILMDNAISYTPDGGRISLALTFDAGYCCFSFSDTGCGIADSEKEHIFERFYRADAAHTDREHFGLGLCIAKELAEKQSGSILLKDAPGGGSCFVVKLPAFTL